MRHFPSWLCACVAGAFLLRKLHLVRPDLIFYPIQFEVWC